MEEWIRLAIVKAKRAIWTWIAERSYPMPSPAPATTLGRCQIGPVLSGGEFTPGGSYPEHYGYPTQKSIDYYASKGMKVCRIPFLWERVQPDRLGRLDPTEMSRLAASVLYAQAKGMRVGLDVHNGGYGYGELIGSPGAQNYLFADLWRRLAAYFLSYPGVMFMLMSEPYDQSASRWLSSSNAAIKAIRSVGATQTIVVPAPYYSKSMLWSISDTARVMEGVADPFNNYLFEVHNYMDSDASGGSSDVVDSNVGAERLVDVTTWARAHNKKLFLGEFAVATDDASLLGLANMMAFIQRNADVWSYATWWGAGDRWQNYMFQLDPADYSNPVDRPQMAVLLKYM